MFFVFSKILSFLFSPLTWVIILLFFALFNKKQGRKRKLLLWAIIIFLFFSNRFIADEFMRMWEPAHKSELELKNHYDAAIVLGGGMVTYDAKYKTTTFRNNTDRILQAVHLYHQKRVDKIIICGGSGSLKYRNMLEGPLLKNYLIEIGIPAEDIWVDSLSDNTHENAINATQIVNDSFASGDFLLISSASHMRRTIACFRHEGLEFDTYPVDFNTGSRNWYFLNLIIPDLEAIRLWEELLHEVSGYIIYAMAGYL
jgi:uncharacterized SAM-binding protein YcdF (DUF218 family)